jgi:hypothetical protein
MKTHPLPGLLAALCLHGAVAPCAHAQASAPPRKLLSVNAPQHDPLFVDADSVQRRGARIEFKYLLDVLSPDDDGVPGVWRSNEIEASIDCGRKLVTVRKLIAYSGRRGSGTATAVHTFTTPGTKPEPITPKSTFAYLEAQLCSQRW